MLPALKLLHALGINICHARYEKALKNHPWEGAKECVETCSPTNAVAWNHGKGFKRKA